LVFLSKYTKTSIEFFLKLQWKEGMMWFVDVAEMAQEEKDALEERTPQVPDPAQWHRWRG